MRQGTHGQRTVHRQPDRLADHPGPPPQPNLSAAYHARFRCLLADTPPLIEQALRLRQEIHCRELGLGPAKAFDRDAQAPDPLTRHCLLQHKSSGRFVGSCSLVIPGNHHSNCLLPLERSCHGVLDPQAIAPELMVRERVGEISRLALAGDFRGIGGNGRQIPLFVSLASLAMLVHFRLNGAFVLMEHCLTRQLRHHGIRFHAIGAEVDHLGRRTPQQILLRDLMGEADRKTLELLFDMRDQLAASAHPTL
jgi:hypothetical protein